MKRTINLITIALMAAMLLSSCYNYPGDKGTAFDQMISVSQWNTNYKSANYNTYYLPDTLTFMEKGVTNNVPKMTSLTPQDAKYGAVVSSILSEIESNMTAYGYTRVLLPTDPADLKLSTNYVDQTYITYYSYYDSYYWGYYPYYYPYYTPTYYSTYSVGALVVELGEIKDAKFTVDFRGSVRIVLGEASNSMNELKSCINECFKQAPILDKK